MPHLRNLNSTFTGQGLNIVAVSDEPVSKIEPFLRANGVDYGVARATGALRAFGGRGYPSSWLIDAAGRVAWAGHPMAINATLISSLLQGASLQPGGPGLSAADGDSSWWLWLIIVPAILFAAAMGWFLYSSRDRTARSAPTAWYPQPPSPPYPPPPGPVAGSYPVQAPQQPGPAGTDNPFPSSDAEGAR